MENWGSISLLNIDYKTKADRISKVLPKLIHEDQTGYVKDRYIGQNIRLVKDIMKVTSLDNIPGMAIFIDFKKAFDSVDWNFLAKVMEAFNFGPQIRKWIKTFYTELQLELVIISREYKSMIRNIKYHNMRMIPLLSFPTHLGRKTFLNYCAFSETFQV